MDRFRRPICICAMGLLFFIPLSRKWRSDKLNFDTSFIKSRLIFYITDFLSHLDKKIYIYKKLMQRKQVLKPMRDIDLRRNSKYFSYIAINY